MFAIIRRDTGIACLAAAVLCFAVLIGAGAWHGRGSRLIDLVASCGMALAFAAIAFGLLRMGSTAGKCSAAGGVLLIALLLIG